MVILAMIFSGEEQLRVQVGNFEWRIGRLFHVVFHVTFHVTFVTSAPLFCCLVVVVWGGFFVVWVCVCFLFLGSFS